MLINLPTHNFKIFAVKPFLNRFYTPSGQKSGLDWSRPKTAVFCGPGPGFGRSGSRADRLESRSFQKRQKDRTGPDLRTLVSGGKRVATKACSRLEDSSRR